MDAEVEHLEAHFAEGGGCGGACQAGADYDDVELALVGGVHQLLVSFIVGPLFGNRTFGDFGIYVSHNFSELLVEGGK